MNMAKRNYNRMKKTEPSVQKLQFTLKDPVATDSFVSSYIDLSQCASLVNRRFYRQGINWAVSSIKLLAIPVTVGDNVRGFFEISKLPNTWVMSNAWEKGFRAWQRMNNDALSETESVRPKFLDFKIFADAAHHSSGIDANLLPVSSPLFNPSPFLPGEWASSKISHPLGVGATEGTTIEEEIIAVGASFPGVSPASGLNAVSLIEGYAASRGLPNIADPNTPDDARDVTNATPENWLAAMFNDGTEQSFDVLTDMITENTIAPYPFENDGVNLDTMYPNGANQSASLETHHSGGLSSTTIGNETHISGANFPCGLIRFDVYNEEQPFQVILEINLVPGSHRGYLCEPMTEM